MKTKQEIEIEGLPEGWRAVAYRRPKNYEKFLLDGEIKIAGSDMAYEHLIVEKIKPRRIVLEETEEVNVKSKQHGQYWKGQNFGIVSINESPKIWREVKEG